ncbi:unnamed protein product [Vitrella brassicaformis CCMP3155]|uniref:Glycosyl transferase CAP10 domain-containing protein n=2 Tax=Vitrella brassicaformis TaxID=1169539 RepID=A0A0G4GUX6_VITBC|nr:unnamed protein product [Vitrella brassicaformis CCMP3155]|eukprot:CEM34586.1 unnamed protein product [Vitrella brassicaformis CCMP3155]
MVRVYLNRLSEAVGYVRDELKLKLNGIHFTAHMSDCPVLWKNVDNVNVKEERCAYGTAHFFNESAPPALLFSDAASPQWNWDVPVVPYNSHNDKEENRVRKHLSKMFYDENGQFSANRFERQWRKKRSGFFFVGRKSDAARLIVACEVNAIDAELSESFYLTDAGNPIRQRNNCTSDAMKLQKSRGCSASHICRQESTGPEEWQDLLFRHKYVLDFPGLGPWSIRLRHLLLNGGLVFQQRRAFENTQFFDGPLKRYGVLIPFSEGNELVEKVRWFQEHDEVAKKAAWAAHTFAWNCLSPEGIRQFLIHLLLRLGHIGESWENAAKAERQLSGTSESDEKTAEEQHASTAGLHVDLTDKDGVKRVVDLCSKGHVD